MTFPTTNHGAEAQPDSLLIGGGEGHRGGQGIDHGGGTDRVDQALGSWVAYTRLKEASSKYFSHLTTVAS